MASGENSRNGSGDHQSTPASPDTTTNPSTRFASITRNEDGNNQSPDTVRHLRPGRESGGSIGSFDTAPSEQRPEDEPSERSTSRVPDSLSIRHELSSPPPMTPLTPVTSNKAKKPPMGRRASTKRQIPHRGQEFSVDDDPSEIEDEHPPRQPTTPGSASGFSTLKRQTSTLRRRPAAQPTTLPRVDSQDEEDETERTTQAEDSQPDSGEGEAPRIDTPETEEGLSDAESFTLKDRQLAINQTHPFGIRIWKPALYKKNRSVEKNAEGDIHSSPGGRVSNWLWVFNVLWSVLFGWWLAIAALLGAIVCFIFAFSPGATDYGRVFWGLSRYLLYPFGQFVRLESDENYMEEDEGEGRSISEYEQWQSGDLEHGRLFFGPIHSRSLVGRRRSSMDSASEHDSLLGRTGRSNRRDTSLSRTKKRFFGRGQWTLGRIIFFIFFYFLITPLMILVSGICWLMVFWIPMGRVLLILFYHLRRHPLALTFHSDGSYSRSASSASSSILLCTYRAVGLKYWKYTVDGTNIFLINLIGVVLFAIFDYWVLDVTLGLKIWLTNRGLVFTLALFSVIPLAYFIGQAVASISAQSSMGGGAAVNAFFSTIVEVYLYCVALNEGKGQLVEGGVMGSILAGILFLPGLSMCFGAIKRKTQRFNVQSAGVTSTMLLFAVVAAFGPTLFYQIYGSHELNCHACTVSDNPADRDCRRCFFSQVPAINDEFFIKAVRPYCWFAAVLLFLAYVIGLWFTLRTHAAVIWSIEADEKKTQVASAATGMSPEETRHNSAANGPQNGPGGSYAPRSTIRDSQLYKRILGQSLRQVGLTPTGADSSWDQPSSGAAAPGSTPHVVPPKSSGGDSIGSRVGNPRSNVNVPGLSEEENQNLVRQVAEMAATAATVAARDATRAPRRTSVAAHAPSKPPTIRAGTFNDEVEEAGAADAGAGGGHDAPNWSKKKSAIVLLVATILYAVIAEVLVNTVDAVLQSVDIDEKFLGITLFALVPNTTEFLNAISFAMNGNIALSMEIGSAYALQVCLLQIPALVLYSAVYGRFIDPGGLLDHTFNLIFPQWDMVTIILCVFLLSYMYGEGKSNYFKGSILVLTYLVVVMGFYFSGYGNVDVIGVNRFDTLSLQTSETFRTIGQTRSGRAW